MNASSESTIRVDPSGGLPSEKRGDLIGRYKLLEIIGEGGMGRVWAADQIEPIRRKVAVKVIKLGMDTWNLDQGQLYFFRRGTAPTNGLKIKTPVGSAVIRG